MVKGAEIIDHAGKRTVALLASLTNLSRPDATENKPVVLADVVQSAMTVMAHRVEASSVQATLKLDPLAVVMGHAGELGQVLVNLVDNAIDAACSGTGSRSITVQVASEPDGVHLTVWDSGPGVSEEDLPKLFEPFFTRKATGTGLGLAIVHQIVSRHGGSIEVKRQEESTGFIVRFPAG